MGFTSQVGNDYVDFESHIKGTTKYYWSHTLILDELYIKIISTLNFSTPSSASKKCNAYLDLDVIHSNQARKIF